MTKLVCDGGRKKSGGKPPHFKKQSYLVGIVAKELRGVKGIGWASWAGVVLFLETSFLPLF